MRSFSTLVAAVAVLSTISSPAMARTAGRVKVCTVETIQNGYRSPDCTASELHDYLASQGIETTPPDTRQNVSYYGGISPEEQARRDRIGYDELVREQQQMFNSQQYNENADRDVEREGRRERHSLGTALLGELGSTAINVLGSRLDRSGYYRGGGYYRRY